MAPGVVRAPHERSGLDVREPERPRFLADLREFLRRNVALDRQLVHARPQVLTEREDVAAGGAEVTKDGAQLVTALAEPEHQTALRPQRRAQMLGACEYADAALVARARPCPFVETRHRLRVVVQHVDRGAYDGGERRRVTAKIRNQYLDGASRDAGADLPRRLREVRGTAIRQVVAVDGGDDDVPQPETRHGVGHARRLIRIDGERTAVTDGAEAAIARAGVAEQHEGRGVVRPALADVRALRFLAHRVQTKIADDRARARHCVTGRRPHANPLGMLACGHDWVSRTASYPKRVSNADVTAAATAVSCGVTPLAVASNVTPVPARPQGTIAANGARKSATFSAKPCIVTQRRMPTPIAASLSFPTQTPVKPGRRSASTLNTAATAIKIASRSRRYACTSAPRRARSTIG